MTFPNRRPARPAHPFRTWGLALAALALIPPGPSRAEGLRIVREGDALVLRTGHEAPRTREGGAGGAAEGAVVSEAICFDADGTPTPILTGGGGPLLFPPDCPASWARVSTGTWTRTAGDTTNVPPGEVEHPLSSFRSFESVKRLDAWSDVFAKPLTRRLEIVPLADPRSVPPGGKIDLLVVRDGRPVADLPVSCGDDVAGRTGPDGKIRVEVPASALVVFRTTLREPDPGPAADEIVTTAGLLFERRPAGN